MPAPRHLVKLAVGVAGALLAVGMTYQGVATALERRDFPPTGARIGIGDHQLHLTCVGDGTPVVVLEAPERGFSATWGRVLPALAVRTRVCAYDRSGLGWSEASSLRFDVGRVADELHALLAAAPIDRRVVLVGQSLGAWYARIYAGRHPGDLAGLVLVDEPAGPGQPDIAGLARRLAWAPWLARTGVLRLSGQAARDAAGLPAPAAGATTAFLLRPDHLTRAAGEVAEWHRTGELAARVTLPASLPVGRAVTPAHEPGRLPTTAEAVTAISDAVFRVLSAPHGATAP